MGKAIENEAQRKQVALIFPTKAEEKISVTNNSELFSMGVLEICAQVSCM